MFFRVEMKSGSILFNSASDKGEGNLVRYAGSTQWIYSTILSKTVLIFCVNKILCLNVHAFFWAFLYVSL